MLLLFSVGTQLLGLPWSASKVCSVQDLILRVHYEITNWMKQERNENSLTTFWRWEF